MIKFTPIGTVHNGVTENGRTVTWGEVESEVVLDPRYTEALDGIEEFSHILVVFWLHKVEKPNILKVRPMRREDLPLVGLFATRSPQRPNPIGVTVVQLLERRGNVLRVRGLDALDGTPVLDIKPYIPYDVPVQGDWIKNARVPEWVRRFNEERHAQGRQAHHDGSTSMS